MKSYPTADELFQLLDDNGIDYVISERIRGCHVPGVYIG
jgi:hypothetical protein